MTTISQLSSLDTLSDGDQFVIYSSGNGCDRKVAASVVADYLQSKITDEDGFISQYASPNASGFSVTVSPSTDGADVWLLLTPLATYAAGTIVLPANAMQGQVVLVTTTQIVTALTVSGNGNSVFGAPTTLAANAFFRLRYDQIIDAWIRVG